MTGASGGESDSGGGGGGGTVFTLWTGLGAQPGQTSVFRLHFPKLIFQDFGGGTVIGEVMRVLKSNLRW